VADGDVVWEWPAASRTGERAPPGETEDRSAPQGEYLDLAKLDEEVRMPRLMKKLGDFARSSQGRQLIGKGKKMAQDPKNQRRLQELRARLTKKR
jgi:hypothetical protein